MRWNWRTFGSVISLYILTDLTNYIIFINPNKIYKFLNLIYEFKLLFTNL